MIKNKNIFYKTLLFVVIILMLLSFVACGESSNNNQQKDTITSKGTEGLEYGVTETTAYVKGYYGSTANVIIPDVVKYKGKEYSVIHIHDYAFSGNKVITTVKIPESVKSIGSGAFSGCVLLKSISIPDNVNEIKENTFKGCVALVDIVFGTGVNLINKNAFVDCEFSKVNNVVFKKTIYWYDGEKLINNIDSSLMAINTLRSLQDNDLVRKNSIRISNLVEYIATLRSGYHGLINKLESVSLDNDLHLDLDFKLLADRIVDIPLFNKSTDIKLNGNLSGNFAQETTQLKLSVKNNDRSIFGIGYSGDYGYFNQDLIGDSTSLKMDISMFSDILDGDLPNAVIGYIYNLLFRLGNSISDVLSTVNMLIDSEENLKIIRTLIEITGSTNDFNVLISTKTIKDVVKYLEGKDQDDPSSLSNRLGTIADFAIRKIIDFEDLIKPLNDFMKKWHIKKSYFNRGFSDEIADIDFLAEYIVPSILLNLKMDDSLSIIDASLKLGFTPIEFVNGKPEKQTSDIINIEIGVKLNELSQTHKELNFDENAKDAEDLVQTIDVTLPSREIVTFTNQIYFSDMFAHDEDGLPVVAMKATYKNKDYNVMTFDGKNIKLNFSKILEDMGASLGDTVEDKVFSFKIDVFDYLEEYLRIIVSNFSKLLKPDNADSNTETQSGSLIDSIVNLDVENLIGTILSGLLYASDTIDFNIYGFLYNLIKSTVLTGMDYADMDEQKIIDLIKDESVSRYLNFLNGDEETFSDILRSLIDVYERIGDYDVFSGLFRSADGEKGLIPFMSLIFNVPEIVYNTDTKKYEIDSTKPVKNLSSYTTLTQYTYLVIRFLFGESVDTNKFINKIFGDTIDGVYNKGVRLVLSKTDKYTLEVKSEDEETIFLRFDLTNKFEKVEVENRIVIE